MAYRWLEHSHKFRAGVWLSSRSLRSFHFPVLQPKFTLEGSPRMNHYPNRIAECTRKVTHESRHNKLKHPRLYTTRVLGFHARSGSCSTGHFIQCIHSLHEAKARIKGIGFKSPFRHRFPRPSLPSFPSSIAGPFLHILPLPP